MRHYRHDPEEYGDDEWGAGFAVPEHLMPHLVKVDLLDVCTYLYWSDGSGMVWDGDKCKAHIIEMAAT